MKAVIVTGAAGLIGSESCKRFSREGFAIAGIDNDMRARFFGPEASTRSIQGQLEDTLPDYTHHDLDIRDNEAVQQLFRELRGRVHAVIHTAAQPSHDWAAKEPLTDFGVNAVGTMNLLEASRLFCPEATFVFASSNKVYGDLPNALPLIEQKTRWEIPQDHPFSRGIDETMSIDQTKHSVFGASKVAADVMVQEYGRYFGLPTACFRGGCLTGPAHAGAELHGFLSYLMKCTVGGKPYRVFGYRGKQVRDNIHSADLVNAFWEFCQAPKTGAVYNIGGSRHSHCSLLEAIELCQKISGQTLAFEYVESNRSGDHIWWISDVDRFRRDYPNWDYQYDLPSILEEIHAACVTASPGR